MNELVAADEFEVLRRGDGGGKSAPAADLQRRDLRAVKPYLAGAPKNANQ